MRQTAGITQTELARRSGVSQSNVSSYERGTRPMSAEMLARLEAAIAQETPGERLRARRSQVLRAIEDAGASEPAVFGSVATGADRADSDLDLVITAGADMSTFDLVILRTRLEDILRCRVDIVTRGGLLARDDHLVREATPL